MHADERAEDGFNLAPSHDMLDAYLNCDMMHVQDEAFLAMVAE